MEVWFRDKETEDKFRDKKRQIVSIVHSNLGMASVVSVFNIPEKDALKLETATGSILVKRDFSEVF